MSVIYHFDLLDSTKLIDLVLCLILINLIFCCFFSSFFSKCHIFFYPELYDFCWKLLMWHRVDFIVPESPRKPIFKKQFLITHFRTNVFRSICLVVKVENFISLFKGSGTKMDTEEVQICTFTTRKKC